MSDQAFEHGKGTACNPLETSDPLIPAAPASHESRLHPQSTPLHNDSATTRAEKHVRHAAHGQEVDGVTPAVGPEDGAPLAQTEDQAPSTRQKGVAPIKAESVQISGFP